MLRFYYVIILNFWRLFYLLPRMRWRANRPARYTLQERYNYAKRIIYFMQDTGRISTTAYGLENLPAKGGYVMYSNHQGKYDALSIVDVHQKPLSLVMDEARSHTMLVAQFLDLLESKRLVLDDVRQGMKIMKEITREVRDDGKAFLIFPEGGYSDNHNKVCTFKGGSFKSAMKANAPIVPVAIIDSYKVYGMPGLAPVKTQVHFLPPLLYDEYKDMSSQEVATEVQNRIQKTILENLSGKDLAKLQKQLACVNA